MRARRPWQRRRFGCDTFLLGNLIFTSFVGASLTIAVLHGLEERILPDRCACTYEEVLPEITTVHYQLVPLILREMVPEVIADDLITLVMALTHPDPARRGLSRGVLSGERQFDLYRCVGTLNTLGRRAELHYFGKTANLDRSAA